MSSTALLYNTSYSILDSIAEKLTEEKTS